MANKKVKDSRSKIEEEEITLDEGIKDDTDIKKEDNNIKEEPDISKSVDESTQTEDMVSEKVKVMLLVNAKYNNKVLKIGDCLEVSVSEGKLFEEKEIANIVR